MRTLPFRIAAATALLTAGPAAANVSVELTYAPAGNVTMFKLAEPEGTACFLKNDAEKAPKAVTAPFALPVMPMMYYQFNCTLPSGHTWTKKIEAKANQVGVIKLTPVGAAGAAPQAAVVQPAPAAPPPPVTPTPAQANAALVNAQVAAATAANQAALQLAAQAAAMHGAHPMHPAAKAEPVIESMPASAFNALKAQVRSASFSSDKINAIKAAAANNHFTVAQVGGLVDQATHSSDKVKIVRILRPKIVDPQNGFQLQSRFTFSSDKKKVARLFQ